MSRSFGKSFHQKIVLPKLRPHCSANCPKTWRAEPQKEKMFLAFRICARSIFSKNGKDIFLWCSALKVSGRWRNNADEVLAKLFFGERICQNFGWFVFEFGCRKWKRMGLGRNFPFAPLFVLGKFGAGYNFICFGSIFLKQSSHIWKNDLFINSICFVCNFISFITNW